MQFGKTIYLRMILIAWLGTILAAPVEAQVIRENEKGEKIIVDQEGRSRYFASGELVNGTAGEADYPVIAVEIEPLEGAVVPLTETDLHNIAVRKAQLAEEAVRIAQLRAAEASKTRQRLEQELAKAVGYQHEQLSRRLAVAKRIEHETALEILEARSEAVRADALTAKGAYIQEHNKLQQNRRQQRSSTVANNTDYSVYNDRLPLTENFAASTGDPDLILHPPTPLCQMNFEGQDPESGQFRREVRKELLFTYTDERLRAFLKEKEYLHCQGFFTSLGGYRFLTLEFTFAYPNAREAYGFIEKGSVLTIRMLNGDYINLRSGRLDRGSYDTKRELLTYQVYYPIDRGQLGILKNSEADAIRVHWSSGYEEYPVHQMDFFKRQLTCLGDM